MYINGQTTYVEVNTSVPVNFRLPENVLGITNWTIKLQSKDSVEIIELTNSAVQEYGIFPVKTTVVGDFGNGSSTIKVSDSSTLTIGGKIRLVNDVYTIDGITDATHVVSLNRVLKNNVLDQTEVKSVTHPEFLGCYYVNIVPTKIGRYIVNIMDDSGLVNPITEDIEVLTSLTDSSTSGKINIISNQAVLG
jgi:hypothetical protein